MPTHGHLSMIISLCTGSYYQDERQEKKKLLDCSSPYVNATIMNRVFLDTNCSDLSQFSAGRKLNPTNSQILRHGHAKKNNFFLHKRLVVGNSLRILIVGTVLKGSVEIVGFPKFDT